MCVCVCVCVMNNKIPIPEELLVNLTLVKYQRGPVAHLNRSEHNVNCHNDHLEKQSESLQIISINTQILDKHKILHQIIKNGILLWFIQPWRISKWPHKAACPTWLWCWLHRWWHIIPWGNTIGSRKFLQWQQHAFFWGVWVWYAFSKSWICLNFWVGGGGGFMVMMVFFVSDGPLLPAGVRSQIPWVAQVSFVFVCGIGLYSLSWLDLDLSILHLEFAMGLWFND